VDFILKKFKESIPLNPLPGNTSYRNCKITETKDF